MNTTLKTVPARTAHILVFHRKTVIKKLRNIRQRKQLLNGGFHQKIFALKKDVEKLLVQKNGFTYTNCSMETLRANFAHSRQI